MSQDTERIPIPTNGTGPKATAPIAPPPIAPPTAATPDRRGATGDVVPRDQTVAFTPNQLAAGFGIVAGLLLLFVGARRRRGGK
jgi:hypothetical protein